MTEPTTETVNGTKTDTPPVQVGLILSDTMQKVKAGKRALEALAADKNQSDPMRRFARQGYQALNTVLAQYLSESE